jgi:hypothetical protein
MFPTPSLSRHEEADRIIASYGSEPSNFGEIMSMLERQFAVLHNRAQVLLTLCGIVISTTGFSGRLIAGTNLAAQLLVILGVSLVLASAAVVVWGVQHLSWLTLQKGELIREWLVICLAYRDHKTRCYRLGIALMLFGLAAYVVAISIMLLNPQPILVPVR